jgi:hypothetical protein
VQGVNAQAGPLVPSKAQLEHGDTVMTSHSHVSSLPQLQVESEEQVASLIEPPHFSLAFIAGFQTYS